MRKSERQRQIRRLISEQVIERQSDFVTALEAWHIPVTQATISRDIKEMQLVKLPTSDGHYRYSLPQETQLPPLEKLKRTLQGAYFSGEQLDSYVQVKLEPGTGPAIAHLFEQLNDERIFAMIPSDANILIICRTQAAAEALLHEILEIVGE
ncbi:arginine repressor [Lacticaseibacillus saniviri]|uniref:Arginine repressor n=1 Tax=Lacticaseibacillus saniviri JCM 17471 = DSM 24301 TaxID=1293598 RepID=A0A0R2N493_9LACO|nr:ArgR family transcriptional regulator [Lacticaseibacillus saniviri]KRO18579.1 arginine repressor [Lacticaseibacillus saniviri JCM 17471 = DSM 24301]MCG4281551.1 ArgR family transcriptional regulator [Lacticaseibacillus saniviri]